jgi:translocator protein
MAMMWVSIGLTMWSFSAINKIACFLFIPYFMWVSFATFLSYNVWKSNAKYE